MTAFATGTAAAAPAGWSSPQDLSDNFEVGVLEGSALNYPDIAVSDGGDAVAVWRRQEQLPDLTYREDIWSRDRPLGGVWSPARLMGTGNGDASDPRVATNAGTTVIAWQSGARIVARVRRAGGDYSSPKNFGDGAEVHVGVDDVGAVTVLWSGGGVGYGIRSARNAPASGWGPTKTISFSPTAQTPDLAVSGNGDAIATWKAQDGVRVSEFSSSAGWTAHRLIGPGGLRPSVATNDAGQVVLAWAQPGASDNPVLAPTESVRALGGSIRGGLGAEKQLSDDILWDLWLDEPRPEAAVGDGGDAVVAWNRVVSIHHDATIQVSSRKLPNGAWQIAKSISVPTFVPRPSIGVLRDGAAIVAWRGGNAAVRPADQADVSPPRWDPPFLLPNAGSDVYNPDIAVDGAGRLHVLWADVSRPQTRFADHLAFMAVQAISFGLPGTPPVPLSPTSPGPSPGSTPPSIVSSKPPGGARLKAPPETLPKPKLSTLVRRGTLYLKVSATLQRKFGGRTLVIQRRVGRKLLRLASVKVPATGRVSKLVALDGYARTGASGVKGVSKMQVRVTLAATTKARAVSSPFRVAQL